MSGQISINYSEVYSKITELRTRLRSELRDTNNTNRQTVSALNRMDGAANAQMAEAVQLTQNRTQATAGTLEKLLMVMETSARQVERTEQNIARTFSSSMVRRAARTTTTIAGRAVAMANPATATRFAAEPRLNNEGGNN